MTATRNPSSTSTGGRSSRRCAGVAASELAEPRSLPLGVWRHRKLAQVRPSSALRQFGLASGTLCYRQHAHRRADTPAWEHCSGDIAGGVTRHETTTASLGVLCHRQPAYSGLGVWTVQAAGGSVNLASGQAPIDDSWQNGTSKRQHSRYPEGGIVRSGSPSRPACRPALNPHQLRLHGGGPQAYDFLATWDVTNAKGKICGRAAADLLDVQENAGGVERGFPE